MHVDNKGKDILTFGKGPTQGLDDTTLIYNLIFISQYPINLTESGKKIILSLYYNGSNNFLFVNATKVYQFKTKDSEIKDFALCLRNILKDFTIDNMKKTGLKGVVIFFLFILILLIPTIF